jgi:BON domain
MDRGNPTAVSREEMPRRSRPIGHVACVALRMDHAYYPRNLTRNHESDVDYGPGWRQARRDTVNDDLVPLLGPPRHAHVRSEHELGAYGYAGQDYPIYGRRPATPDDDLEPGWFADPTSSAYAYGYTTSMRSNDPFPSSGFRSAGGQYGKGPKDYVRADARVLEDVCDRLSEDDEVDASNISVSVVNGEVTLVGTVVDRYTKRRAEHVAASVRGVVDVQNRLHATKGVLRELKDKLAGDAAEQHHGHHGSAPHGAPSVR